MGDVVDVSEYVQGHRRRVAREREARLARYRRAAAQAKMMGATLAERFPVSRIWLFGSILAPDRFDERSDVDIACQGLPPDRYFEAYGALEGQGGIPFDLVRIETCSEGLAERIRREGKLIYGAP